VILGNGIAGQTCAEDLRKADADASITIVAAERHPLYNRVALPRYLRGQVRREKVFMRTPEHSAAQNIDIHFETWATEVRRDPDRDRRPAETASMAGFHGRQRLPGLPDP